MIDLVFKTADTVPAGRESRDILTSLVEEVGELSTEIGIQSGHTGKTPGPDGILGESIDVILCALDMIRVNYPDVTEEDIVRLAEKKCDKWLYMRNKWAR
jgi:hypothetical protein